MVNCIRSKNNLVRVKSWKITFLEAVEKNHSYLNRLLNPFVQRIHPLCLLIITVLIAGSTPSLKAAHLVGGEISYVCLGNNFYKIKLRVYRDCASGGAQFDTQAAIAIYDTAGNLINNLMVPKGPTINVPADSTGNPCVSAPPGLCTEYAEYVDSITLPPISGGYVITHQRCCRNASISNVLNSNSYGNTYTVQIPSMDTLCNSSPQFTGAAPIVLCLNESFNLPMKVTEGDGDSLHYELCNVFAGGGSGGVGCNAVVPNPPCAPPYSIVPFASPFTATSPMPSTPDISLDPITGVLSGNPSQLGQYLVGICVTEYRNGIPLSTVRLDYQFNISNCIVNVVSDMVTPIEDPQILCDGLRVSFKSESQNALSLLWNFGDPAVLNDTSTDPNPTYHYTIPGFYKVTLIANPGTPCSDTATVTFDVKNPLKPEIGYEGIFCFEAQEVFFSALGTYPSTASFEWNFSTGANFGQIQSRDSPGITWSTPGWHFARLSVTDRGCTEEVIDSVLISNLAVAVDAGPDQSVKRDSEIQLRASGGTQYYWFASEPVDFANPWGASTSANLIYDSDSVIFYVRVRDDQGCEGLDSLLVYVFDEEGPINFISPNNDGKNDFFDLSDLNPDQDCMLQVFNRWGSEVYFESNYDNMWTGLNRGGNELPDGTYYYILSKDGAILWRDAITIMRNNQ